MSKAIVLYTSHSGNTEKVAMKIAEGLETEYRNNRKIPNLTDYDLIVIGGWVMFGRISFSSARFLKKLRRKNISGKKIALFFTAGDPDEINPFTERSGNPKTIKQIMFETMEKMISEKQQVTFLTERFYCKGAVKMFKNSEPSVSVGHPTPEDLTQAKSFGEQLKNLLKK
ncbi:MAG: flavodoxin family protein [Candidatus Thorarchaeota archaeon]